MKSRRGNNLSFWPGDMGNMINQFKVGDIVTSVIANSRILFGIVADVNPKTNKVMVSWNGGSTVQHDPDEIILSPESFFKSALDRLQSGENSTDQVLERLKTASSKRDTDVPGGYTADPEKHGLEEPRGSGFSIMQDLQDDLHKESYKDSGIKVKASDLSGYKTFAQILNEQHEKGDGHIRLKCVKCGNGQTCRCRKPHELFMGICQECSDANVAETVSDDLEFNDDTIKYASTSLRCRRALYWAGPGRTYKVTKEELDGNKMKCPYCKIKMKEEPFSRSVNLYRCRGCNFKITSDKVVKNKIEIEVNNDGSVDIGVVPQESE